MSAYPKFYAKFMPKEVEKALFENLCKEKTLKKLRPPSYSVALYWRIGIKL